MALSRSISELQPQQLRDFVTHPDLCDHVRCQINQQIKTTILNAVLNATVAGRAGEAVLKNLEHVLSSIPNTESVCAPFQRGKMKGMLAISLSYLSWSDYFSSVKTCTLWNLAAKQPISRQGSTVTFWDNDRNCPSEQYIWFLQLFKHTHLWRLARKLSMNMSDDWNFPFAGETEFCSMFSTNNIQQLEILFGTSDGDFVETLHEWVSEIIPHLRELRTTIEIPFFLELIKRFGCLPNLTSVSEDLYVDIISKNKITRIFSDTPGSEATPNALVSKHLGNKSSSLWKNIQCLYLGAIRITATSLIQLILFAPNLEEFELLTLKFVSDVEDGVAYLETLPVATKNTTLQSITVGHTHSMHFFKNRSDQCFLMVYKCVKKFHHRLFHFRFAGFTSANEWNAPTPFDATITSLTIGVMLDPNDCLWPDPHLQVIGALSRMEQLVELRLQLEAVGEFSLDLLYNLNCFTATHMMPSLKQLNLTATSHCEEVLPLDACEVASHAANTFSQSQLESVIIDLSRLKCQWDQDRYKHKFEQASQAFETSALRCLKKIKILMPPIGCANDISFDKRRDIRRQVKHMPKRTGWSIDYAGLVKFKWESDC